MFYNKDLAAKIGMTEPPKTLDELDRLLATAKAAGIDADGAVQRRRDRRPGVPAAAAHGLVRRARADINYWIYQKDGATIDTPENLEAAQHLRQVDRGGLLRRRHQLDGLLGR